jgi:hypothetical protein
MTHSAALLSPVVQRDGAPLALTGCAKPAACVPVLPALFPDTSLPDLPRSGVNSAAGVV